MSNRRRSRSCSIDEWVEMVAEELNVIDDVTGATG